MPLAGWTACTAPLPWNDWFSFWALALALDTLPCFTLPSLEPTLKSDGATLTLVGRNCVLLAVAVAVWLMLLPCLET